MLAVSVRQIKALTVRWRHTQNLTYFVYQVYAINSILFFLADILFLGVVLDHSCLVFR